VPATQAPAPGLSELRPLRGTPGNGDRVNGDGELKAGLESLGVPPEGGPLFELALTHRSFAFEQAEPTEHNERLEFLGDAVLGTVVTDMIYNDYPELAEGDMARLRASVVNMHALAEVAREHDLGRHIRLGKGEEASRGRDKESLLANTLEALIGALYLDRGLDAVRRCFAPMFSERVRARVASGSLKDVKNALQELVARARLGIPVYQVQSSGPDHDKKFSARVFVDGLLHGEGTGSSKKEAEQAAARAALVKLGAADGGRYAPGGHDARAS
jgi:ribonuclease-3